MKEQQHGASLLHQIFLMYINLGSLKAEPLTAVVEVFTVRIPCVVFMYQMIFFDQQHFLIHRHRSFLCGSISTHSTLSKIPTFLTVWFSAILRHLISDNQSAHSTLEKHLIDIIS